jgi:nicotinate-nucleotide adenylyltransferase
VDVTGQLGGAFDPPHNGHVVFAVAAADQLGLDELEILVVGDPGHKSVVAPAQARLELARLAFPAQRVTLDPHARTVDSLRAGSWRDPVFLIGADEFCDLLSWKEPEEVLRLARLGVASRPGFPRRRLDDVLRRLPSPERVLFFEIEPVPVSSTEIRERLRRGEPIDGLVPSAVAAALERMEVYR